MKRTTYIMMAMLLAGLVAIGGVILYIAAHASGEEKCVMKIEGERKNVPLPACRVVKLQPIKVTWKQTAEGRKSGRSIVFDELPLEVVPADSLQGCFSYASGLDNFLSFSSVGDTLVVAFDFSDEKLDSRYLEERWLRLRSEGMRLELPAGVQTVLVDTENLYVTFRGLRRDTLNFRVKSGARMEDCEVASLTAHAMHLRFNSGTVRDLYLNLDGIYNWSVNTDSFHIDTEHLSSSGQKHNRLQKGECREVRWTPLDEKAVLSISVQQPVKIIGTED